MCSGTDLTAGCNPWQLLSSSCDMYRVARCACSLSFVCVLWRSHNSSTAKSFSTYKCSHYPCSLVETLLPTTTRYSIRRYLFVATYKISPGVYNYPVTMQSSALSALMSSAHSHRHGSLRSSPASHELGVQHSQSNPHRCFCRGIPLVILI